MEGVARFLEEFAVRVLLPHLEVRIRNLNHQVSNPPQRMEEVERKLESKQSNMITVTIMNIAVRHSITWGMQLCIHSCMSVSLPLAVYFTFVSVHMCLD